MYLSRNLTAGAGVLTDTFSPYIIKNLTLENRHATQTVTVALNATTTVAATDPIILLPGDKKVIEHPGNVKSLAYVATGAATQLLVGGETA